MCIQTISWAAKVFLIIESGILHCAQFGEDGKSPYQELQHVSWPLTSPPKSSLWLTGRLLAGLFYLFVCRIQRCTLSVYTPSYITAAAAGCVCVCVNLLWDFACPQNKFPGQPMFKFPGNEAFRECWEFRTRVMVLAWPLEALLLLALLADLGELALVVLASATLLGLTPWVVLHPLHLLLPRLHQLVVALADFLFLAHRQTKFQLDWGTTTFKH